ncbi:MAG: FAD-dependent oxidoreductase [Rhizobiaceae bacterium]|nr:FAD-dependent oxidoreductase [Rhizobiaceae bacterium]
MACVIVVGAGFCGLAAAGQLAGDGFEVTVLEARSRVGGRVEARPNGLGETVDTGGQFICDDMPEVMRLARRHRRALVKAPVEGRMAVVPNPEGPEDTGQMFARFAALRERLAGVDPDAAAATRLTVARWAAEQPDGEDAKRAFLSTIEGLWCQSPEEMPLWYLIENDRRITNSVSELQYFLKDTMSALAGDLAAGLGENVRLDAAVSLIERDAGGVTVRTGDDAVRGDAVLVAVPPMAASRIVHDPALPERLSNALSVWRSGAVVKVLIRYEKAFWRDSGMSGQAFYIDTPGLYATDVSMDDEHPALVAFIGGRIAREWRVGGETSLRETLLVKLVEALGEEAASPMDMAIRDWTDDRWSGGAYSDVIVDMEARDAEDVIRAGDPPLFFDSSELSPSFPGYIEGAIVAGRQAASAVAAFIRSRR